MSKRLSVKKHNKKKLLRRKSRNLTNKRSSGGSQGPKKKCEVYKVMGRAETNKKTEKKEKENVNSVMGIGAEYRTSKMSSNFSLVSCMHFYIKVFLYSQV